MNHTPTPWGTKSRSGWDTGNAAVWSGPTLVAQCGRQGTPEQLANAAFIVRACNAHDAVAQAVRNLLAYLPEGDDFQNRLEGALLDALELAGK